MLQQQEFLKFGVFVADLRAAELKKGERTVPLQNLPFRVLKVLLRDPGKVVTREELRHELWPADTFVDFERGISTAVNKLRDALGDSASNPKFIETVGRRGYRFIAPISVVSAGRKTTASSAEADSAVAAAQAPAASVAKTTPASRIGARKRSAFIVLAIAVIALAVLAFDRIASSPAPRVTKITQLTNSGKAEPAGGLQTDGARLFFLERSAASWSLMQTSVTGGEAVWVQIPLENPILLGISPDRTQMLLTTRGEYGEKHPLWIMPIQGGPPQRVGDVMVDSAGWFKDGQRLLCTADHEVFSVERDGTQRRHLFNVNGVPFRFSWRPDGSSVRFSVVEASNVITLWDASADGSNVHPVLPGWNVHPNECCGSWSADGQNYVFRANRDGQEDLWLLHEAPGWPWSARPRPVRLTNGPTSFSEPVVSQDGRKIFATGLEVHGYVAHLDPMSGQLSRAPLPENAFDLTFSHDGKWVAYIAPPGLTLWRSRIDGSEKLQLTMPPFSALTPRWSPDDTKLVFTGARGHDSHQTYIVAANGGALERVIENDTLYRTYPDWSPDQQSLIVGISSVIHAPDAGITLVDLKTHRISELPGSKGLAYPRWSPRGNYIAAATQDFKKIFLFDVRSQTWKQMATTTQFWKFEWERDGSYLYYQDIRDPAQTTFRLDPSTGAVTQLANCTAFHQDGAIRCSFEGRAPDGSLTFSVRASWANLYAFDVELP